ncbi:MAG: zinc-dependent alcohol dehydrogenase family protein [Acidimicrobiales bacterium]
MQLSHPGPGADRSRLDLVTRPDPVPAAGEVLIDVSACSVCRTDLQIIAGDLSARRLPIVPGHQIVGRVAARGEGVDAVAHPIGDRVGVAWIAGACGHCRFCTTGRENLCEQLRFTGWDRDGGYADQVTARADFTYRLPDGFDDLSVAPLLCGGAIGYRSLGVAGVDLAQASGLRLGLYGFGASATCTIQVAVHAGCDVYVATRSEVERARALALGATWVGGYDDLPPVPLDAAITFAPAGSVVAAALRALDRGGTVAINAIHLDHISELDYDDLWLERSLRSVANVTRADVVEFLELAAAIPVQTQIEVFPLDQADEVVQRLEAGAISGAAVLQTSAPRVEHRS